MILNLHDCYNHMIQISLWTTKKYHNVSIECTQSYTHLSFTHLYLCTYSIYPFSLLGEYMEFMSEPDLVEPFPMLVILPGSI